MIERNTLTHYLEDLLANQTIPNDKSNNGLQIEGKSTVANVIGGVDACLELYQKAIEKSADYIIVHHGESWGEGIKVFTGLVASRFRLLFQSEISLYASHLPLDAHRELGHNAQIAKAINLLNWTWFAKYADVEIGVYGELPQLLTSLELATILNHKLTTQSRVYDFTDRKIKRIGIISGSGLSAIYNCKQLGIDCLITGEGDHTYYHIIKELGMTVITCGHYKTEVPGVIAVLEKIEKQFGINCEFIDIPTDL